MGFLGSLFAGFIGGLVKALFKPFLEWRRRRQEIKRAKREEAERVETERLKAEYNRIQTEPDKAGQELIDDLDEKFR